MVRITPLCLVQFAAVAVVTYVVLNTSFLDAALSHPPVSATITNNIQQQAQHLILFIFLRNVKSCSFPSTCCWGLQKAATQVALHDGAA